MSRYRRDALRLGVQRHRFPIEVQLTRNGELRHPLCEQSLNLFSARLPGLQHLLFSELSIRAQITHC